MTLLPHRVVAFLTRSCIFNRVNMLCAASLPLLLFLSACQPLLAPDAPPDVDRVGLPADYQETFSIFYEFDRPDNRSARVIYANPTAAKVQEGQPFPYGSMLVMEVYRTQRDDAGNVVLDENGRFTRDELFGQFVMRKEPGFGAKYGEMRNGEWEYAAYRADGSVLVPPEGTTGCAACHMEAGLGKDWVFGAHRHFGEEAPAPIENSVNVIDYTFTSDPITVTVGTEVIWHNHDVLIHTVTSDDLSFNSGALRPQGSFSTTFDEAGVYEYWCAIHGNMHGTVVVTE